MGAREVAVAVGGVAVGARNAAGTLGVAVAFPGLLLRGPGPRLADRRRSASGLAHSGSAGGAADSALRGREGVGVRVGGASTLLSLL